MKIDYNKMKKEDLIKICEANQSERICMEERFKRTDEDITINRDLLLENIHLKEELEDTKKQRDLNYYTIQHLQEQIEVYKDCIKALSRE